MRSYTISILETNVERIKKFQANQFLIKDGNFEFNTIDEAKNSPLAQQLFYLPFVKKVYISSNFVAIERYNIVEWSDVENEVAEQIEAYLNNNGVVINQTEKTKKLPVTVYAESTPNPAVMKFVSNKPLVNNTIEFESIDATKHAPLAQELFNFPFVKRLFFDENYISITKYDIAEWNDITMQLREFIRNYLTANKPIVNETEIINTETEIDTTVSVENLDNTSKEIVSILDQYIKPAVAGDGGNIKFINYNASNKNVKVMLQGACSGCPSSTLTLKNGIETLLKEMLNEPQLTVEAING